MPVQINKKEWSFTRLKMVSLQEVYPRIDGLIYL